MIWVVEEILIKIQLHRLFQNTITSRVVVYSGAHGLIVAEVGFDENIVGVENV